MVGQGETPRAATKAKHSWHSPALSARYGEMENNEPRYKPRSPDGDAGWRKSIPRYAQLFEFVGNFIP